ncbi:O-antigen ligase family protein [Vulcanibacillus modesticaldus]|nr:O-antigen ligase family protein [Vulcanibacillus modesticaldus]
MFFDQDFYWIETGVAIIFLFFMFLNWEQIRRVFKQPVVWLLSLVTFLYLITALFAENQLLAYQQFFRWLMATQFFILVLLIKEYRRMQDFLWYSILLMGTWTAVFGWLAAYKLTDFKDAFLGYRISSVFQYPNTYAVILAAVLIAVLIRSTGKKKAFIFDSFTAYLLLITLIFTYSRGAWLVFALVWFVGLLFLRFKQQILYIFHSLLIGLTSILTLTILNVTIKESNYFKGFLILITGSLVVGIIYSLISMIINKAEILNSTRSANRFIFPIIIFVVMIIGVSSITSPQVIEKLPDQLQKRISDINLETRSVVERNNFVTDATTMIKDRPFFGAGGGAWKEQFERYQSYPYISRQAHNFYYQLTVEIGIVGLILFLGLLLLILLSIIKARKSMNDEEYNRVLAFGFMVGLILVHSYIDFNMSYAYVLVLVMILLGLLTYPLNFQFKWDKAVSYTVLVLIVIMSLTSTVMASRFIYADRVVKKIVNIPISEAEVLIAKAINANPYETKYRFEKINLYLQVYEKTKNNKVKQRILAEALKINAMKQKNPTVMLQLSQVFAKIGFLGNSLDVLDVGIKNGPWRWQLYEQDIIYSFNLAKYYKQQNNQDKFEKMISRIYDRYNEVVNRREYLDQQVPVLQYKGYKPSLTMRLFVGQTKVVEGKYKEGLEMLLPLTKVKDARIKRDSLAWSAYIYQKMGNLDKANKLIQQGKDLGVDKIIKGIYSDWEN